MAEKESKFLGKDTDAKGLLKDGTFRTKKGNDLVQQDIEILLLTKLGERPMNPMYGCRLASRIWDNMDDVASAGISDIWEAINAFEPRVTVIDVKSYTNRSTGKVSFSVKYEVKRDNTIHNLVYPFKTNPSKA